MEIDTPLVIASCLTQNATESVQQRVQSDASFAQALLDEAATLFRKRTMKYTPCVGAGGVLGIRGQLFGIAMFQGSKAS